MTIDLTQTLAWTRANHEQQQMLQALQGNILKGHGRKQTINMFFHIDPTKSLAMKRALRELANFHITSAERQLRETQVFQEHKTSGTPFVAAFLSASGYAALGLAAQAPQGEPLFLQGMRSAASIGALSDPPVPAWEPAFQNPIDGMVLVGEDDPNTLQLKRDQIAALLDEGGATIIHEQRGAAVRDHAGQGIEHFGYVDGRSQPLLLQEDVEQESAEAGISRWDPQFSLGIALVKDKAVTDDISFGSYFIFRKLEQNVQGFKRQEQVLATKLGLSGDEARELAGALVVGRFEDGTPVTLSDEAKALVPPNDFDYTGDAGQRCPFHGHIRKVNPRGSGPGGAADERTRLMPRRGIPYTDKPRKVHASDLPGSSSLSDFDANVKTLLPTKDVGLLFMAYNARLAQQFVFTQASWANNAGFPAGGTGIDPIIGQSAAVPGAQHWQQTWDDAASPKKDQDFHGFVTMKGGEYFFAPSLTFFRNL